MKTKIYQIVILAFILLHPYTSYAEVLGDINSDGKVGLEEAIYALQVLSGLKPTIFATSDLNGTWNLNWLDTDSTGNTIWAYGLLTLDNTGNLTAGSFIFQHGFTGTVTGGSFNLDVDGKLSGSFTHSGGNTITINDGKMDPNKNIISFVDSSTSGAHDFGIMIKN